VKNNFKKNKEKLVMGKKFFEEIELFLFDMDGLLFDTETIYVGYGREVAKKMGYTITKDIVEKTTGVTDDKARILFKESLGQEFPYDEMMGTVKDHILELAKKSEVPLILQDFLHNFLLIKPARKLLKENIDFFNRLPTLEKVYDFGLNIVPSDIPDIPYLKEIIKHTDSNTKFYVNDYHLTEQNKNDIQNNLKNWGYNGAVQFINMMQNLRL